jgi:hypothetical protein
MRVIMTAANFSPAIASRNAKYDGDFRVPTLSGAQPLDAKYRHGSNIATALALNRSAHHV